MMGCPYSDYELTKWQDVANAMGPPCRNCEDYDCIHNETPNPEDDYIDDDPMEEFYQDQGGKNESR